MRKMFMVALVALSWVAPLLLTGCPCPEKMAVAAFDQNWEVMGLEYRAYIEADPKFQENDAMRAKLANRLEAIAELDKMLQLYREGR